MGSWVIPSRAAAALAVILATTPAAGHVQPSVDENNRYLKLGLLGDRVRLVYTLYVGERPGARARRMLDRDRDGMIDPSEGDRYGKELADQIASSLELEVDGAPYPLAWHQISVGLGTPTVTAGAFAVDLVTWICVADPTHRRQHAIVLHDRFRLPQAGETEIYVEESPGVTVTRSTLGRDARQSQLELAWRGDTGYLRDLGLYLDFVVGPEVSFAADSVCGAPPNPPARGGLGRWRSLALVTGLLGSMVGLALWWRRRTATPPTGRRTGR